MTPDGVAEETQAKAARLWRNRGWLLLFGGQPIGLALAGLLSAPNITSHRVAD